MTKKIINNLKKELEKINSELDSMEMTNPKYADLIHKSIELGTVITKLEVEEFEKNFNEISKFNNRIDEKINSIRKEVKESRESSSNRIHDESNIRFMEESNRIHNESFRRFNEESNRFMNESIRIHNDMFF